MLKIDPAFLFELSTGMRRVREVREDTPLGYAAFLVTIAKEHIEQAVENSIYSHLIRMPARAAQAALEVQIEALISKSRSLDIEERRDW